MDKMIFANSIKVLRKYLKLTQTEFGKKIGKRYNTVQTWEYGQILPDLTTINHICSVFNLNPSWLRTGVGEMFVPPQAGSSLATQGLTGIHAEIATLTPKLRGKYAEQALEYIKERLKFQKEDENALSEKIPNKKTA